MSTNTFKSGFVSLIGRPNVGKSTLLNRMIGEKIAIVSPRPQTTRNKILGIVNEENSQIILIDTPGIHNPKNKLGQFMLQSVDSAMQGIDCVCFLLDACDIRSNDHSIIKNYCSNGVSLLILINKIDLVQPQELLKIIDSFKDYGAKAILPISAMKGEGIDELKKLLHDILPEGPKYFPDDMITDIPERTICAEIIREKSLLNLKDEVPHGIGVEILSFETEENGFTTIHATIYCEKESHKRIILGKQGQMIKKIGSTSRFEIENLLGNHIHLDLWVKVRPGWRNSTSDLKTLGYFEEK